MATMKYIGARYMPKFMGTYDATTVYEALSVVDNGAGTTYVANKPAPAGTPLTNTEYWTVYGASSGAILDLQSRMDTAENDIDNLQNDMTGAQGDINFLEGDMTAAIGDITELEKIVSRRRFIIVSDSYGAGYTPDGDVTSFIDTMRSNLGLGMYYMYKAAANYGSFGSTVKFKDILEGIEAGVPDKDTITDIVVCGGYNDRLASQSDIATGMATFKTYARSKYPNAALSLIFIGWSKTPVMDSSLIATDGWTRKVGVCRAMNDYSVLAGQYGFSYLGDVSRCLYSRSYFSSDGFHPNGTGQAVIANYVADLLYKGRVYLPDAYFTGNLKFIDNGVLNGFSILGGFTVLYKRGLAQISLGIGATLTTPLAITFDNQWHPLAWIDSNDFQCPVGNLNNSDIVGLTAIANLKYTDGGTKYLSAPMSFAIYQNILYYTCQLLNAAGTGYHASITAEAMYVQNFPCAVISPLST